MPTDPMAPRPEDEGEAKRWYVTHRIDEQVKYYRKGQEKNEVLASRPWWVALLAGLGRCCSAQSGLTRRLSRRGSAR
jgi:hypothetical protein